MNPTAAAALARVQANPRGQATGTRDLDQILAAAKRRGRPGAQTLTSKELAAKLAAVRRQAPNR